MKFVGEFGCVLNAQCFFFMLESLRLSSKIYNLKKKIENWDRFSKGGKKIVNTKYINSS